MIAFPEVICDLIADYTCENKLLPWIDINKLNWELLSENPAACDLFKENPDKINWDWLSMNPAAIDLLIANTDKI